MKKNDSRFEIQRKLLETRGVTIVLTGVDGSGKTTLAKRLGTDLASTNLPSRSLHLYTWYASLFLVPLLILRNRYFDKTVLVLDRSIYDNLAVMAAKRNRKVPPRAVSLLKSLYPGFDYAFYLSADRGEISRRRPSTDLEWHDRLVSAYEDIIHVAGHRILVSDRTLYSTVISVLRHDPTKSR